jgi:hypothetical protein
MTFIQDICSEHLDKQCDNSFKGTIKHWKKKMVLTLQYFNDYLTNSRWPSKVNTMTLPSIYSTHSYTYMCNVMTRWIFGQFIFRFQFAVSEKFTVQVETILAKFLLFSTCMCLWQLLLIYQYPRVDLIIVSAKCFNLRLISDYGHSQFYQNFFIEKCSHNQCHIFFYTVAVLDNLKTKFRYQNWLIDWLQQ